MANPNAPEGRPSVLEEELVPVLVDLFDHAAAMHDRIAQIAMPDRNGMFDNAALCAAFQDAEANAHRTSFRKAIVAIEPLLPRLPQQVVDAVAELGRIYRAMRQNAVSLPDCVLIILRLKTGKAAARGRLAVQATRAKNANVCDWAVDVANQPVEETVTNAAESPAIVEKSGNGKSFFNFTDTDNCPLTTEGHIHFLELVRDEVQEAAEYKRRRVDLQYDNDTINCIVQSVRWDEASVRFQLIADPDLPLDVLADIRSLLNWPMSRGTIEQLEEPFALAIARLRAAWQALCANSIAPGAASSAKSLVTLIERTIRRLKAKSELLRAYLWEHPAGLNAAEINRVAATIPVGPIFAIGEAADWARAPNLPDDHPINTAMIECLTVFHPDGTKYAIHRTGGMLDDTSCLPVDETIARLEAWRQCAANALRSLEYEQNLVEIETAGDLWKAYAEGKRPCHRSTGISIRPGANIATMTCTDDAGEAKRVALDRAQALVTAEGGGKAAAMERLIAHVQLHTEMDKANVINMPLADFVAAAMSQRPVRRGQSVVTNQEELSAKQAVLKCTVMALDDGLDDRETSITNETVPPEPIPVEGSTSGASFALLSVFTRGVSDERLKQASRVLVDAQLSVNQKLERIDALMSFPPTASAKRLGEMLGVTKQAILKTSWWKQNRQGEKNNEIGRRHAGHLQRAKYFEPDSFSGDDEVR